MPIHREGVTLHPKSISAPVLKLRGYYDTIHLFAQLNHQNWLIDTGSPATFGVSNSIHIGNHEVPAATENMGLTAEELSMSVKTKTHGMIGTDVLNQFDWIFDIANSETVVSTDA